MDFCEKNQKKRKKDLKLIDSRDIVNNICLSLFAIDFDLNETPNEIMKEN